jgi:hypothetical protein
MESTVNTNSRLTNEINRKNRVIVDAWNRLWKLRHWRPEIVSENIVGADLEITTEIWVTTDVWNRQHDLAIKSIEKIEWWLSMELSNTLCQCWSRNRHQKLSHCRTRNHLWKLSHGWWMESTANTNSRLTNEIKSENWVTVEWEIIFENWVMLNGWNPQWILIHD